VTPTGLVLWPVCGPILSARVLRTRTGRNCLAEDHHDLAECPTTKDVRRPLSPLWRPRPGEYCGRGIRGNVPARFRRRPPAPGTNHRGSL